ncbi:MAG: hypothetical protein ABIP54_01140, partial [Candidatus Andersenbacteria bacterium]
LGTYPSHVYSFLRGNHAILDSMNQRLISWIVIVLFFSVALIGLQNTEISSRPIIHIPETSPTINFHTPVLTHGFALPLHITSNLTIGPNNGTVLINNVVTVEKNISLTILPGTTLAVSEFGGIDVLGSISAVGTPSKPITFITNELNETNRHWVGILLENSSHATLTYIDIHHASPAISCAPLAQTNISNISFLLDAVGFASNTFECTIL